MQMKWSYTYPEIRDQIMLRKFKDGGINMTEEKGLNKPVKLKTDLAALLGADSLPRTEITKKLWDYIKANKLQTTTVNGKPENAGKYIVADAKLIKIFNNTKTTSKTGKVTDLTKLKEGQTIDMMQMASVVSANIE
jgi:chromatin remodeling complex protein RSC6